MAIKRLELNFGGFFLIIVGLLLLLRDYYPDYSQRYSGEPLARGYIPFTTPKILVLMGTILVIGNVLLRFFRKDK